MALAGTGFSLELRATAALRPHEETIPSNVEEMVDQLKKEEIQKDPIIVDRETGTVLDGMHRLAAFKVLGLGRAVCCAVDYFGDRIDLRRWGRTYEGGAADEVSDAMATVGLGLEGEAGKASALLKEGTEGVAAFYRGMSYLQTRRSGLQGALEVVSRIDSIAEGKGWRRGFVPDHELESRLGVGDSLQVMVRRLAKSDVINAARTGSLFPCKTSMHIIDPRPVAVDFPISDLTKAEGGSLELIATRGLLLPEGSTYEGRRYKERLILLNQR